MFGIVGTGASACPALARRGHAVDSAGALWLRPEPPPLLSRSPCAVAAGASRVLRLGAWRFRLRPNKTLQPTGGALRFRAG